jgi:GntR family transcriptional regulator/MocR family aminotransferase
MAAGLHLVLHLPGAVPTSAMVRGAGAHGVHVVDLDAYRINASGPPALVLGYGNITDALVPAAVAVLADVLADAIAVDRA